MRISGILLAAGAGSRFGGRKLIKPLSDGTPIGVAALRNLRDAIERVIVVIRSGDAEMAARFAREGVPILECRQAAEGMGHSLAAGVAAESSADGWVIALGDMPRVRPNTIRAVAQSLAAGAAIVIPCYREERGHPVAFASTFKEELLALSGDAGARAIVKRHAAEVVRLDLDDPGVLEDVDTLDDLVRLTSATDRV
jgi:molybdenum cofactor cytidylyltransferase